MGGMQERCGHFGQRRTESLLLASYWWPGLRQQVAAVVQMCEACDRARQSFNRPHATLSPLSIRGLLYRWSIDLCGPFPLTRQLNSYCMVLVEGHCRWAEMVAIPGKESAIIARVFLERVVGCYGCCAEVVSDGGHLMLCSPAYSSITGPPLPTTPRPMGWLSGRCKPLRGLSASTRKLPRRIVCGIWQYRTSC